MTRFAMTYAARRETMNDQANADTRPYRDIGKVPQALPAAPVNFSHGRAVDIGIEGAWDVEGPRQRVNKVSAWPSRFRCRQNMSVAERTRVDIDRTECPDPQRVKSSAIMPFLQDSYYRRQRVFRPPGGDRALVQYVVWSRREGADAFGAAKLDPGISSRGKRRRGALSQTSAPFGFSSTRPASVIEAEAAVSVPMCPSKQKEIIRRP